VDESQRLIAARALLGQGVAGQAADIRSLRQRHGKESAEAQMNGQSFPSFEEWSKEFMQTEKAPAK
jgi:hypothetical protein